VIRFFDGNCSYGRAARPPFRYAATAQDLLREMDFCGIDSALVHHTNMRFSSPREWNPVLVEEVKSHPRLQPTWAILPSQTGEFPKADELAPAMRSNGIRALWAFPAEHRYCLDSLTFGPLLEVMANLRMPLLAKDNLLSIKALLKEQPGLIVVAMNQGPHSLERYLRPMLDAFPNLHVETSCLIVEGLIEEFCRRYGPNRLIFGSGFPNNCAGASLLHVAQADIGPETRQAVAAGNLERLLGEVRL
jgi:predicted TIM-barrel fold metal-dependent hydrolase